MFIWPQETDGKEEQGFKSEATNTLQELVKAVEQWETQQMLGGQYDKLGAVLSIQVHTVVCMVLAQPSCMHVLNASPDKYKLGMQTAVQVAGLKAMSLN